MKFRNLASRFTPDYQRKAAVLAIATDGSLLNMLRIAEENIERTEGDRRTYWRKCRLIAKDEMARRSE